MSAPSVSTHPTRRAVLAAGLSLAATAGASAQGSGMITQKPRMQSTEGARTMATMTTTDGTEIFYKDWGSGQPIVFHHGWPLSADDWDSQMLFFLHQGYRVIAHDRRGHGRSTQTAHGNEMDTYADDVVQLAKALDLKNAIHIGHSTGGGEVARYVARAEPGRVAKAVLIGAVPPDHGQVGQEPGRVCRSRSSTASVRQSPQTGRSSTSMCRQVPSTASTVPVRRSHKA